MSGKRRIAALYYIYDSNGIISLTIKAKKNGGMKKWQRFIIKKIVTYHS